MISWATILYGAALTFVLVGAAIWVAARGQLSTIVAAASASAAGALAWNAIVHSISGVGGFFVDAPIAVFPASWQDTGSGVFALGTTALALGFGPLRAAPARAAARFAASSGFVTFAVDMYLY